MNLTNKQIYLIIFWISLLWTVLSLYYSYFWDIYVNIRDGVLFDSTRAIKPCDLCWYIRLAQYPTTLVSWITLRYKDYFVARRYIIWLTLFWILISGYKVGLEYWIITLDGSWVCWAGSVPCDVATYLVGNISLAAAWLASFIWVLWLTYFVKK